MEDSSTNTGSVSDKILLQKVLKRTGTSRETQLEIGLFSYMLHCVYKKNKKQVETILRLSSVDLINLTTKTDGMSALHLVTLENDLDMAQFLLSQGTHPDIQDKKGRTAMMMAAQLGYVDIVKLLASYQANVNLVDTEGNGLLFYCLISNKVKPHLVDMALKMGADVNNVSRKGKSVFMLACEQAREYEDICLWLLEKGADPNIIDQVTGNTALMLAAKAGSVKLVREILKRGVNPNAVNKAQQHTAHIAAFKGSIEVLRMLSAYSADFTTVTCLGETPLHEAAAQGHAECCRFLLQRGCSLTRNRQGLNPIGVAEIFKQSAALKELKKAAQSVNTREPSLLHKVRLYDWALEHEVALMDSFQVGMGLDSTEGLISVDMFISLLKAQNAPVDDDILEIVASKLAESNGSILMKELFLGYKFLPETHVMSSYKMREDSMDEEESTSCTMSQEEKEKSLMSTRPIRRGILQEEPQKVSISISDCVKKDNFEYLKLAFNQKVCVDVRDRYYKTPLMTACINGKYQMAEFLIGHKANVNAHDQLKWTSLHHACMKGHADMVRLLLKHSAIIDAQTLQGVTPLMRAIMSSSRECVKVLLEAGANISISNKKGHDCMVLAQMYGGKQICELLKSELQRRKMQQTPSGKKQTTAPAKAPAKAKKEALTKGKGAVTKDLEPAPSLSVIGLKPLEECYETITLPSANFISGEKRVPMHSQLRARMHKRSYCYVAEEKLVFKPKPPPSKPAGGKKQ